MTPAQAAAMDVPTDERAELEAVLRARPRTVIAVALRTLIDLASAPNGEVGTTRPS
jgi:hypothetical protein